MTDTTICTRIAVKNPSVRKNLEEIINSTEGLKIQNPGGEHRPDLLILELGNNGDKEFEVIEPLLNSGSVGEVFLTSENSDSAMLLQAMRTGAKEFFSQPLKEQEVRQALERLKKRRSTVAHRSPSKSGQIVNILGSKGGVGATTVAVNLAVSMALNKGVQSAALVDMNMVFGEIPLFLSLKPNHHWGEIIKHIDRLDSTFLMNVLSPHTSGVHVLSSPSSLNGNQPATPETVSSLLNLMQTMFDFVVIDAGQSLNDTSLRVLEMCDNVLLVSLLSLPYLSNTNKLLASFSRLGYVPRERVKVVVNRYHKNSDISLKDAEEAIEERIFWTIPNDYKTTMSAINHGKPLPQIASRASVTKSIVGLADALIPKGQEQEKRRWKFLKR